MIFRGILPKIIFQKTRYEQFHKIHGKSTVIESLVKLQPHADNFTEKTPPWVFSYDIEQS